MISKTEHETVSEFIIPIAVVSKRDVVRLARETENIDTFMTQAKIRQAGESMQLPKTSKLLETVADVNGLNLLENEGRKAMKAGLTQLIDSARVVHISFASSPSAKFLEKITQWFRREIDPNLLLEIGLQPSIAAGFTLRTNNKYYDFSLRKSLAGNQNILLEKLRSNES